MKKLFGKSSSSSQRSQRPQFAPPAGPPPNQGAMQRPAQSSFAPPPGPPPPLQQDARPLVPGQENAFAALKRYDLAILVDDSESMEMFWDQTRDALVGVAKVAVQYDPDGIDLYFMNSTYVARHVRTAQDVANVFRRVEPRRSTPTATALARVLNPVRHPPAYSFPTLLKCSQYIDSLEQAKAADGAPNRGEEPEEILVSVAKRLDAGRFPPYQLGIQFILVAEDDEAATALQSLDDDLKSKYSIRDIVDFTPFSGHLDQDFLLKVRAFDPVLKQSYRAQALLGGINRKIDSNQGL